MSLSEASGAAHAVASVGASSSTAGPPQGASTPSGGSAAHAVASVGASSSTAGPPQGASTPSGGSAAHAVASVGAFIFDMDGTMVDSMPSHSESWLLLAQRHGIEVDLPELMRRTTGRTGLECMRILFDRDMPDAEAVAYVHEKETLYRELFAPKFAEVHGFSTFASEDWCGHCGRQA
jgi:hypothetical protein